MLRAEDRHPHAGSFDEQTKKTSIQFVSMMRAYLKDEAWRHVYEREHPRLSNDMLLLRVTARQPSPFSRCPHWWEGMNTTPPIKADHIGMRIYQPRNPPATRWQEVAEVYFSSILGMRSPSSGAIPHAVFDPRLPDHIDALLRWQESHPNEADAVAIIRHYQEYLRMDQTMASSMMQGRPPPPGYQSGRR